MPMLKGLSLVARSTFFGGAHRRSTVHCEEISQQLDHSPHMEVSYVVPPNHVSGELHIYIYIIIIYVVIGRH